MPFYVIRLHEFVGVAGDPRSWTPPQGAYLKRCDHEAHGGRGEAEWTPDVREALRFESHADAVAFYTRQSRTRPLRPDGKANRPLTAFSVTITPVEEVARA